MIVAVDGKQVTSADDVVDAVADKQPGDTVEIEYYRGDDKRTATVKLGERPEQLELDEPRQDGRRPAVRRCPRRACEHCGRDPREDLWSERPGGRPPGRRPGRLGARA